MLVIKIWALTTNCQGEEAMEKEALVNWRGGSSGIFESFWPEMPGSV